jgi:hypothetical protein
MYHLHNDSVQSQKGQAPNDPHAVSRDAKRSAEFARRKAERGIRATQSEARNSRNAKRSAQ